MNLINQFPDVSMDVRAKLKRQQKNYSHIMAMEPQQTVTEKTLADFYDNEFRKWHIKVALMITGLLAGLFFVALSLPRFFS